MSGQQGDPWSACRGGLADGARQLVLQVVDGAVHDVRIGRAQLGLQQLHGHGAVAVGHQRAGEHDHFAVAGLFAHTDAAVSKPGLLQLVVELVAGLRISALTWVNEAVLDVVAGMHAELVQQVARGLRKALQVGRQFAGQVHFHVHDVLQSARQRFGGRGQGVALLTGQVGAQAEEAADVQHQQHDTDADAKLQQVAAAHTACLFRCCSAAHHHVRLWSAVRVSNRKITITPRKYRASRRSSTPRLMLR